MSHLALAEHAVQSLILCCGNDSWGLHEKMSSRLQTSLLIHTQNLHCKSPRLRTVLAQFAHGRHVQDRLTSVLLENCWMYCDVITVAVSRV
jgi:hypothetical protein